MPSPPENFSELLPSHLQSMACEARGDENVAPATQAAIKAAFILASQGRALVDEYMIQVMSSRKHSEPFRRSCRWSPFRHHPHVSGRRPRHDQCQDDIRAGGTWH